MGSYCLMDIELQFFKMKRVLEMNGGLVAQQYVCHLKMVKMANML